MRKAALALVLAGACCGLGVPASAGPRSASPVVHRIAIEKMAYLVPAEHFRAGDTILWVNNDIFRHTATARDRSFDLDLPAKGQGRTVLAHAGSIAFSCKFHPAMKGMLSVSAR